MPQIVVAQRMWQRRDTAANWATKNPVLAAGEIGIELGATVSDPQREKLGNGVTPWNSLAYHGDPAVQDFRNAVTAVVSSGGVITLDWSLGDYFTITLTENVSAWIITNLPGIGKGFSLVVQITQGATPYTVARPDTAPGGTFAVSTAPGDIDLVTITSLNNGANLRSNIGKAYS